MKKPIQFGKYHLLERINVGGMAEVFRAKAYGVEGFERLVAVKRILPNIAEDGEFITMFIDEAKIAVQLNHANIAQIFDLGVADGAHYIAMEHVLGKDLRAIFDRCRQRGEPMPVAQACFVVMKMCEGLDYAHNKRDASGQEMHLVHRDVSPQNVIVSFEGEVKVIDFGIAKAAGKGGQTQAGILKGKFGYMSPEQVRGLPIDRRSDIFATGIVLYELLTDERLFIGESDFSTLEKVRNVEILPPTTYNRKIPEELERIVLKSLAKDVDERYQNAIDLHDELQAFVYTAGEFYSRKDLTAWMKKTFAKEIDDETAKVEEFRKVGPPEARRERSTASTSSVSMRRPNLPASPPPLPPEVAGINGRVGGPPRVSQPMAAITATGEVTPDSLDWDEEELETQIYDTAPPDGEVGGAPALPQAMSSRGMEPMSLPAAMSPPVAPAAMGTPTRPPSAVFAAVTPVHAVEASGIVGAARRPSLATGTTRAVPGPPPSAPRRILPIVGTVGVLCATLGIVFYLRHQPNAPPPAASPPSAAVAVTTPTVAPAVIPETSPLDAKDTGFDVTTDPVGAKLRLDGRYLGEAPLRVRNVTSGRHLLEVDPLPGFAGKTEEVIVEDGRAGLVRVTLDALEVTGTFKSEPPGARVILTHDGIREVLGPAPIRSKLDPRQRYMVSFERDGYVTTTRPVELGRDPDLTVVAVLEKERDKVRSVTHAEPPARREPERPRVETPPPPPPRPIVEPPARPRVEDSRGDPGFLSIGTRPPCKIFIDGRDTGLVTPQRGLDVPPGTHKVTLINNEFGIRESYAVPVKAGETVKVVYDYSDRIRK